MNEFRPIEKYIREARLQRSAAIGMALGEWLAEAWLGAARVGAKLSETLAQRAPRTPGPAPSR